MKISDLTASKSALAKEFNIDLKIMDGLFELLDKGKIANPDKLFKKGADKLKVQGWQSFMLLDMGQKSYFLLGCAFPEDAAIKDHLKKIEKELTKAKEKEKAGLEAKQFFLQSLKKVQDKAKGTACGELKFANAEGNICYMEVKKGVSVSGNIKKGALADTVKNVGYELAAKNGEILQLMPLKEDDSESASAPSTSSSPSTSTKSEKLEKKAQAAENLLEEVQEITQVYDRDKKEELQNKTDQWLSNYEKLADAEKTPELKAHLPKIQAANLTVKNILAKDDKITGFTDKIFATIDKYLEMEDVETPAAEQLAGKIVAALDKVVPLIEEINDTDLLQECKEIQEMLK